MNDLKNAATNHGVTQAVARADGFTGDMRDFPKEWAQKIVYEGYIVKPGFLPLVDLRPHISGGGWTDWKR